MPARRKVTQKTKSISPNKEILRKNFNRKLVQLQRIIYDLSFSLNELILRRDFIIDWFNQRIDKSISVYRDHIIKIQKGSVQDFSFIVERTERFYKRKYENFKKELAENIGNIEKTNAESENKIQNECSLLNQQIKELNEFINNQQVKINELIELEIEDINKNVKKMTEKGKAEMKKVEIEYKSKSEELNNQSDLRIQELTKKHSEQLEAIKTSFSNKNPGLSFQYQKLNDEFYKKKLADVLNEYKVFLSDIKQRINDELLQYKNNFDRNKLEKEKFQDDLKNKSNEMLKIYKDQQNQKVLFNKDRKIEYDQQLKNFQSLVESFQKKINDKQQKMLHDSQNDNSTLNYLKQSFKASTDILRKKIAAEQNKKTEQYQKLKKELEDEGYFHKNELEKLNKEKSAQKIQNRSIVDSYQKSFFQVKDSQMKQNLNEINLLNEKISKIKNDKGNAIDEYSSILKNLNSQKNQLLKHNHNVICEFESKFEFQMNQLNTEMLEKIDKLKNQISEMLNKEILSHSKKIETVKSENNQKLNSFKSAKEKEHDQTLELIRSCGYSKAEYQKIDQEYKKEYEKLQSQFDTGIVIVPESDVFKNMLNVIKDLKAEKIDHETINQSRKNCINVEFQEKIDKENKQFSERVKRFSLSTSPRARDQAKKAIQMKIDNIRNQKLEQIDKLTKEYNSIISNKAIPLNAKELESDANQIQEMNLIHSLQQAKEEQSTQIEQASLNYQSEIQKIFQQLDQAQKSIYQNKEKVQDMCFNQNRKYDKESQNLNDVLTEEHQKFMDQAIKIKNEQKSKVSSLKQKHFNEREILQSKINELKQKIKQNYVSPEEFEKTREAWTKQRTELDCRFSIIKGKFKGEIEELRQKKEEISKSFDKRWQEIFERKSKLALINSNKPSRTSDLELIEKLEGKLKILTSQLMNAVNDIKKYKNIYIAQEKQINKKFGGIPDVGILHQKTYNNVL